MDRAKFPGLFSITIPAAALAVALLGSAGCADQKPAKPAANALAADSLYTRLGGHDGVAKLAGAWVDKAVADTRINARFAHTDAARLKMELTNQICEKAGGPEVYTGKDMKTAHKGMNLSEAEWDAFMDDFKKAMDDVNIGTVERQELLVDFEPMKSDVVGQ